MHPLTNGVLTGLFLQFSIGPVFLFVMGITLTSSFTNGFFAVLAVTLADYLYIFMSLLGIGGLLGSSRRKRFLAFAGPVILILFGMLMCYQGMAAIDPTPAATSQVWTPLASFTGAFVLTASSPLTIFFWGGIFSTKAVEHHYSKNQLTWFGIGAGLATLVFLAPAMYAISRCTTHLPAVAWQAANGVVGLALIGYGISRAGRAIRQRGETQ